MGADGCECIEEAWILELLLIELRRPAWRPNMANLSLAPDGWCIQKPTHAIHATRQRATTQRATTQFHLPRARVQFIVWFRSLCICSPFEIQIETQIKIKSEQSVRHHSMSAIMVRLLFIFHFSFFLFLIWKSLVSAQFADIKVELPMWNGEMWKFTESAPPFVIVQLGLQSRPPPPHLQKKKWE